MADSLQSDEKPKMRKLPPLSPRGQADNGVKKVVKKKKKQSNETELPEGEAQENNEPKPAKPKRRARSQSKSRDDNEDVPVSKTDESPAPKKKKRKAKPAEGEDAGADKSAAEAGEDVTGSKASLITGEGKPAKKKGKKKKVKKGISKDEFGDTALAADLTYLADDVVTEGQKEDEESSSTRFKSTNILRSQPTEKLYVETNHGFKGQDKTKLAKKWAEEEEAKVVDYVEPATKTTMEFGLQTHRVLKTFCLFLHGLLAGIALWHIVVVYVLSRHSYEDFLLHYRPLSLPVQCMYYILLALCTVSACDRCDIGNTSGNFFRKAFSLQNTAVAILIYFLALFLSLSIVATEDKINLFDTLPELWQDKQVAETELELWKTLNTVRGVVIILGWVVLSIAPNADRLGDNLQEGDDDEMLGKDLELAGVTHA